MNAKSAGRRGTPTARDASLFDDAISGAKTALPLAGNQRQGAGRWCSLDPGKESKVAQVAAVRVAVLVDAAGQREGSQQRAYHDQARKPPPDSCNLLWRSTDGPYSIAAERLAETWAYDGGQARKSERWWRRP